MCVYMYTYIVCVYIHICVHTYIYTHTHICIHTCRYIENMIMILLSGELKEETEPSKRKARKGTITTMSRGRVSLSFWHSI